MSQLGFEQLGPVELAVTMIGDIGTLACFTFAWHTIERVPMDFSVELDGRPDDEVDALGTRLILGVGFEATDHLTIHAHGGYATRAGAYNGGARGRIDVELWVLIG